MSNQQLVETKGIYHGLPVHPPSLGGLTTIITGANGISGNYIGIYASEQKHLGDKLEFPGDLKASQVNQSMSSSSRLNEDAKNEKFNTTNGTTFMWWNFWPKYAGWYTMQHERPSLDDNKNLKITSKHDPPSCRFRPPATYRARFRLVEWVKEERVQKASDELT